MTITKLYLLDFLHFIALFKHWKAEPAVARSANIIYVSANAYGAFVGSNVMGSNRDAWAQEKMAVGREILQTAGCKWVHSCICVHTDKYRDGARGVTEAARATSETWLDTSDATPDWLIARQLHVASHDSCMKQTGKHKLGFR